MPSGKFSTSCLTAASSWLLSLLSSDSRMPGPAASLLTCTWDTAVLMSMLILASKNTLHVECSNTALVQAIDVQPDTDKHNSHTS